MNIETILPNITTFLQEKFKNDSSGHDFFHLERVVKNAKHIQKTEGGNLFLIETAAWLHDVYDSKLVANEEAAKQELIQFLEKLNVENQQVEKIILIIDEVSFSKNKNKKPSSLEAEIVQDADRLDALGAIGIARTFAYGGHKNRELYNPKNNSNTIQHFYDKLFLLKDLMNTQTAQKIAQSKHQIMEQFVKEFMKEWEGISD